MILPRVIPCLLLSGGGLVKTVRFQRPVYLGDPRNAVKIFNDREADELLLLDIRATPHKQPIQFDLIREIVSEAFMPVGYGGGIHSVEDARRLLAMGVEKVIFNTAAVQKPGLVREAASQFGSSSVVVCMDYKRNFWKKNEVYVSGGSRGTGQGPEEFAVEMENLGAGELMVNCMDRDGTMQGYDLETIQAISRTVNIPVIASGGAGSLDDFKKAIQTAGASAVAAGSMFVFQGKHRAVLINYPSQADLRNALADV